MDHRGELLCAEESGSEIQMSSDEESENHSLLSSDEQEVWLMKSTNGKQSPMLNLSAFPQKRVLRVYSRRWLVLMLFSLLSFMQVFFPFLNFINFFNFVTDFEMYCIVEFVSTSSKSVVHFQSTTKNLLFLALVPTYLLLHSQWFNIYNLFD